ncbi:MAG: HAAS signaling domain-containing protein [Chlamydiota bacterium]
MTTLTATDNVLIEQYLRGVAEGLKEIGNVEKQDILAEIRSHLGERIQQLSAQGTSHAAEQATRALGEPTALAHQFVEAARQQRAGRSYAPWVLLHAAARTASSGAKGLLVFLIGLVGYGAALAAMLTAVLKHFIPQVGLWVGSWGIVWGLPSDSTRGRELLGQYFIPATIALAFVFASGCTVLLQRLLRLKSALPRAAN